LILALAANAASIAAWPFRAVWRWLRFRHAARRAKIRKPIFIGFDGLGPMLTERWMGEGTVTAQVVGAQRIDGDKNDGRSSGLEHCG
jgi:hypothetical protein